MKEDQFGFNRISDEELVERVSREVVRVQKEPDSQEEGSQSPLSQEEEAYLNDLIRRKEAAMRKSQGSRTDSSAQPTKKKVKKRKNDIFTDYKREHRQDIKWMLLSGHFLLHEYVTETYKYLVCIAVSLMISIMALFYSLHLDMYLTRHTRDVQLLRERSVDYQLKRFSVTSHSAISRRLNQQGIMLYDPQEAKIVIED